MIKKGIGSLLAVSVVAMSVAVGGASAASNQSGPASSKFGVGSAASNQTSNGQGASVTGYQFQAGKVSSPSTFTQISNSNLTLTSPTSTTTVNGTTAQQTSTQEPTHVVQNQVDHTSGIQYDNTFAGGIKIQHQQLQRTSINYSAAVQSVTQR